jgi:hypothetical protein
MALGPVERVDHCGGRAAVSNDCELRERSNARRIPAVHATITSGEAVAGMILHGLGFAPRPLSLPPQFGARSPRELWCREGVEAEMFNRGTRGRTLDAAYAYGGALLLQERALAVCAHAGIDLRCHHLDTTRVARSGEDLPEGEAQAMTMTHGCATEHRPDLQPAVLELLVSHDGGGPCVSTSGDGTTADSPVCQVRARGVRTAW